MELRCVMQWFICNRFSVNIKKTNFVLFGNQAMLKNVTNQTRCKLFMGNIEIGQTNTAKFLGIIIDSNLTWKPHIDNVAKKVSKSVGIIKRVRHCLPVDTLNTLYNTLILPYINYCNIIWARNKVTKMSKYTEQQKQSTRLHALFVLQKKIVRIITLSPYNSHSLPLLKKLNQLTIYDINKLAVATFMYRYENNFLPQVFSGFFVATSAVHDHYTRSSTKLHISFARTNIMWNQLRVHGPKLWNSIDRGMIEGSKNWHSFKRKFKSHLLRDYV